MEIQNNGYHHKALQHLGVELIWSICFKQQLIQLDIIQRTRFNWKLTSTLRSRTYHIGHSNNFKYATSRRNIYTINFLNFVLNFSSIFEANKFSINAHLRLFIIMNNEYPSLYRDATSIKLHHEIISSQPCHNNY